MEQVIAVAGLGVIILHIALRTWFSSTFVSARSQIEAWRDGYEYVDGWWAKQIRWLIGGAITCRFCLGYHLCLMSAAAASAVAADFWWLWILTARAVRSGEFLLSLLIEDE